MNLIFFFYIIIIIKFSSFISFNLKLGTFFFIQSSFFSCSRACLRFIAFVRNIFTIFFYKILYIYIPYYDAMRIIYTCIVSRLKNE